MKMRTSITSLIKKVFITFSLGILMTTCLPLAATSAHAEDLNVNLLVGSKNQFLDMFNLSKDLRSLSSDFEIKMDKKTRIDVNISSSRFKVALKYFFN